MAHDEIEGTSFKLERLNSFAQESSGLKRSITTAAALSFLVPILIIYLTLKLPFTQHFVQYDLRLDQSRKLAKLALTNLSDEPIDYFILNFDYGGTYLEHWDLRDSSSQLVHVSTLDKPLSDKSSGAVMSGDRLPSRGPSRPSFEIKNLEAEKSLVISLRFVGEAGGFKPKNIVRDGVRLIDNSYKRLVYNSPYYLAVFLAGVTFAHTIWRYLRAWRIANKLDACLSFLYPDIADETKKKILVGKDFSNFLHYCKTLRDRHSDAPAELQDFGKFLQEHNLMLQEDGTIYLAAFDVIGNPTFSRFVMTRKTCLVITMGSDVVKDLVIVRLPRQRATP